jgi:hypothetical protein
MAHFARRRNGAPARPVGLGDGLARLDDHAARGEVRAGDEVQERLVAGVGRLDEMQAGVAELGDVVGRDVGGHAHRDAGRSVGEQVREGGRQHDGLAQRAVVVVAEVDRILVEPFEKRLGGDRHARFGVARGGRVVAVDVAEVPLPVHERVAHVEVLREPRHRVVDRASPCGW